MSNGIAGTAIIINGIEKIIPEKADMDNGYVQLSKDLMRALAQLKLSGNEMSVIWCIIDHTYGCLAAPVENEKKPTKLKKVIDVIPYSEIRSYTGLKQPQLSNIIKKLQIINVVKNGNIAKNGNVAKNDNMPKLQNLKNTINIGINPNINEWILPKMATDPMLPNLATTLPKTATYVAKNGNIESPKPPEHKQKRPPKQYITGYNNIAKQRAHARAHASNININAALLSFLSENSDFQNYLISATHSFIIENYDDAKINELMQKYSSNKILSCFQLMLKREIKNAPGFLLTALKNDYDEELYEEEEEDSGKRESDYLEKKTNEIIEKDTRYVLTEALKENWDIEEDTILNIMRFADDRKCTENEKNYLYFQIHQKSAEFQERVRELYPN
jgi:hypothetical protein